MPRSRFLRNRRLQFGIALVLLLALALAGAWRWTSLHEFADPRAIAAWLDGVHNSHWAPLAIILLYVVANTLLFPNTALNFATILALGTVPGLPYALLGSLSAALAAYAVGRRYGPGRVRDLHSRPVEQVATVLRRGGIMSVALLRLVPLAPYTVVNLVAGAARVKSWHFAIGTVLGLLPGNLLVTAFGHQLRAVLREPTPEQIALMAAIGVGAVLALWQLRHLAVRPLQSVQR